MPIAKTGGPNDMESHSLNGSLIAGSLTGQLCDTGKSITLVVTVGSDVVLGRDPKRCNVLLSNGAVSSIHLRIYCIIYDKEISNEYPPLVYCEDLSRNGTLWNSVTIGKGTAVLLSEGDSITIRGVAKYTFHAKYQPVEQKLDEAGEKERRLFADRYKITNRKLGAGGNGAVYMAINQLTKRQVACKILTLPAQADSSTVVLKTEKSPFGRSNLTDDEAKKNIKTFLREAKVLQSLSHPNVMGLEKVFRSEGTIYIFQELLTGGDLFSYVELKGSLKDTEAAVIVRQVLKGLEYLHGKNIAHRDLKPDNILITSTRPGSRVVLTDFGCAREIEDNSRKRMTTLVGTTEYIAPEIHTFKKRDATTKGYTKAVDIWALGVVTYVLLTTNSFLNETDWEDLPQDQRILKAWQRCLNSIECEGSEWADVGPRPKDFLRRLLVLDEEKRVTVEEALCHPWFTNKAHKAEFEAVYGRATKGWKPTRRDLSQNVIEAISLEIPPQDQAGFSQNGKGSCGTVSSSYFSQTFWSLPKTSQRPYTPPSQLIHRDENGSTISSFPTRQSIRHCEQRSGIFAAPVATMYKPVHPAATPFKGGFKVPFPKYNTKSLRGATAKPPGCNVGAKRTAEEAGKHSATSEHFLLPLKKPRFHKADESDSLDPS